MLRKTWIFFYQQYIVPGTCGGFLPFFDTDMGYSPTYDAVCDTSLRLLAGVIDARPTCFERLFPDLVTCSPFQDTTPALWEQVRSLNPANCLRARLLISLGAASRHMIKAFRTRHKVTF